jgi:ATP-binding cassette subfamily F protein 3
MLRFEDLALRRGPLLLFEKVDLALHAGWRVGISGRNGAGKSSLLALIAGELAPDHGDFTRPRDWTMAFVRQEVEALETLAIEYVLDGDRELRTLERALEQAEEANDAGRLASLHERMHAIGGYAARARAGELMHGLGFADGDELRPVREYSGGWRMRLNLAQALMSRSDLLLLDEPTKHLDLDAVLWLEQWLRRYPGTLLLISHDREFLDAVVTHVVSIDEQRLELFSGNLSAFERKRSERLLQQQAQIEKQQRERAHLQRFVDRFRAKASKARQAQSRIKALERMVDIAPIRAASSIRFEFREPRRLPTPLLALDEIAAGYGERTILDGVRLTIAPGERIALLGANGAGKSTLIKLLAGTISPRSGERVAARDLAVGYFAQHQLEQLDAAASPVDHLKRLDPALGEQAARDFLGGFGFDGDRALSPVAPFSGGEKARLCLALTVHQRPNLLLLDEPTNHLDLDMREGLTEALNGFEGAVVLVSHDRSLIRTCCDTLLLVAGGQVTTLAGDLDDDAGQVQRGNVSPAAAGTASKRREDRRDRAGQRARSGPLRQAVQRLERRIDELTTRLRHTEEALADPQLYETASAERIAELNREAGELATGLGKLEDDWLAAQAELEQAAAS